MTPSKQSSTTQISKHSKLHPSTCIDLKASLADGTLLRITHYTKLKAFWISLFIRLYRSQSILSIFDSKELQESMWTILATRIGLDRMLEQDQAYQEAELKAKVLKVITWSAMFDWCDRSLSWKAFRDLCLDATLFFKVESKFDYLRLETGLSNQKFSF